MNNKTTTPAITLGLKKVTKGFCRCGCGKLATDLNKKFRCNDGWIEIKTPQAPINVHVKHMAKFAYGTALNTRTNNKKTSTNTHEIKAVLTVKDSFEREKISLILRQGVWNTKRNHEKLTVFATLDARQAKSIDTIKAASNDAEIQWYLDGKPISEYDLDGQLAYDHKRNLHGENSVAEKRMINRKK